MREIEKLVDEAARATENVVSAKKSSVPKSSPVKLPEFAGDKDNNGEFPTSRTSTRSGSAKYSSDLLNHETTAQEAVAGLALPLNSYAVTLQSNFESNRDKFLEVDHQGEVSPFRRPARIAFLHELLDRQEKRKEQLIGAKRASGHYGVNKPPGTSPGRMQGKHRQNTNKKNVRLSANAGPVEASDRKSNPEDEPFLAENDMHLLQDDDLMLDEWDRAHQREDSFANQVEQQKLYLDSP